MELSFWGVVLGVMVGIGIYKFTKEMPKLVIVLLEMKADGEPITQRGIRRRMDGCGIIRCSSSNRKNEE